MNYTIETYKEMLTTQDMTELYRTYNTVRIQANSIETIKLVGIPVEAGDEFWALEKVIQQRVVAVKTELENRN